MPSPTPPEDDAKPQLGSSPVRTAISDPLRVYLLFLLEKRGRLLGDLQRELPGDISFGDLEHHVETLRQAGLVEVDRVGGVDDTTELQYKARLGALLEASLSTLPELSPGTPSPGSVGGIEEVEVLLRHPTRRRLLRALALHRVTSTVTDLMGRQGLSREASSCLNYHARVLASAGLVEVIDELPVYRSLVANDDTITAFLRDSAEIDGGTPA